MLDHLLVMGSFIIRRRCEGVLVLGEESARGGEGFGGDASAARSLGGRGPPGGVGTPVDVGAVAAAIGAAVTTTKQETTRGDIQTIGRDFPVRFRFVGR
jgi:hypothetical protein